MPKGAVHHLHYCTGFDWDDLIFLYKKYNIKINKNNGQFLSHK